MSNLKPLAVGFFAHDQVERTRINDLIAAAQRTNQSNEELCARVRNLADVGAANTAEIARLQAVVYTLMQVLVESGLDAVDLNQRVATALQALEPRAAPPAPPAGSGPYR